MSAKSPQSHSFSFFLQTHGEKKSQHLSKKCFDYPQFLIRLYILSNVKLLKFTLTWEVSTEREFMYRESRKDFRLAQKWESHRTYSTVSLLRLPITSVLPRLSGSDVSRVSQIRAGGEKSLHNYSNMNPPSHAPETGRLPSQSIHNAAPGKYSKPSGLQDLFLNDDGGEGGSRHSGITVCRLSMWWARTHAILLCRALKRGHSNTRQPFGEDLLLCLHEEFLVAWETE